MRNINLEVWEDDEFIITINGKPIGATINERNGRSVIEWLKYVNLKELQKLESEK